MARNRELEDILTKLYHSFRAPRRRYVVQFLEDERTLTTRELAKKIASLEQNVAVKKATGEPYRNAYNALSQTHLPTLSEAGVIIYDTERQTVQLGAHFDIAALLLKTNTPTVEVFCSIVEPESNTE
ncbi:DUF7344 domain-containing protein [Halorientalis persicus]|uniref:DUF7344 domain-containing protein n=1 Tax=Halorientalis persicus TaxID=1367881 RepID=UPI000B872D26|nr:hypothetical protein [Halorientalis persicus]